MDASHPEVADHIRQMEKATREEVRQGKFDLPRVRDKALWSLFYNAWLTDKSGLAKFTRRGEGIMTWKLIYDVVTGEREIQQ